MTTYAEREQQLLNKIRTRGYFEVEVRPSRFDSNRMETPMKLVDVVRRAQVSLAGWEFPYFSKNPQNSESQLEPDWLGHALQFEHHLEVWRLFRSAQFFGVFAVPYEWRDESGWWPPDKDWAPNAVLGAGPVVDVCTWVFEFAARLANLLPGDDALFIGIAFGRTAGRHLNVGRPNRSPIWAEVRATADKIPVSTSVDRAQLLADPFALAVNAAKQVFELFQWAPADQLLRDLQSEGPSRPPR
jgi:hypothetical protein